MKAKETNISAWVSGSFLTCFLFLILTGGYAQKNDSTRITLKSKTKLARQISTVKGSVQSYEPGIYTQLASQSNTTASKSDKILTITKIYPVPLVDQLNINFKLGKESVLMIKITDLLGNEVSTLTHEKLSAGEYTKTYNLPAKLNPGIYFLRIVAGGEPVIRRISVI